ncbi:MAG: AAA family ATPase [bacterium]|nr:AAA family ATPase [bacterium]
MLQWIQGFLEQDFPMGEQSLLSPGLRRTLRQLLQDCESLYRSAAQRCLLNCPESITSDPEKFVDLMQDLHRGVLIKTLIEIAHCDRRWTQAEREVALIVMQHVWGVQMTKESLAKALDNVAAHAEVLKWRELAKPFIQIPMLKHEAGELRSIILRLGNLIAKADGQILPAELTQLERLENELKKVFAKPQPRVQRQKDSQTCRLSTQVAELVHPEQELPAMAEKQTPAQAADDLPNAQDRQRMFKQAMRELDGLIGLDKFKDDVRQLVDFLKIQAARKEHQLPVADISLHSVFEGNPGTGKTTVARIIARLLCGLGILDKGHTVETDRSGLVAKYAGQTGPRTNERIDEALGGVLFIDEAYSLLAENVEDAFGVEAVQTLLKRMEDDRDRFVVVLAGYPEPMKRMLRSNPGLSSRFQRTFLFEDYDARDLLRIFYTFCQKYHYQLPKDTRKKLLLGFQQRINNKDEHFGNGRLARNLFEDSIRRMSSRIVDEKQLTRELLTTIEPGDIEISC